MSQTDLYDDDLDDEDDANFDPQRAQATITKIRKERNEARKAARIADEERAELASLRAAKALGEANIPGLNARQQAALLRELDGQPPTPEALREAAIELKFIVAPPPDPSEQAQAQIAAAASGSAAGAPPDVLTPQEIAGWDMGRRMDFMKRHPDKWDAIERGESVRVT